MDAWGSSRTNRRKLQDILSTTTSTCIRLRNPLICLFAFNCLLLLLQLMGIWRRSNNTLSNDEARGGHIITEADMMAARSEFSGLTHLVMVACHSIFIGADLTKDIGKDGQWDIEHYQVGQSSAWVEHIKKALEITEKDPQALLLFSGGMTHKRSGPRTEGTSYWTVAAANDWFGMGNVRNRVNAEDFARDSYENVIFSLCRFHELVGQYPAKITVVGYEFKRQRFIDLHRHAIKFPEAQFFYVGVDPPVSEEALQAARAGELTNSFHPFTDDPYGCGSPLLNKKQSRNPFARTIPYGQGVSCPALSGILNWCNSPIRPAANSYYLGSLPWTGE